MSPRAKGLLQLGGIVVVLLLLAFPPPTEVISRKECSFREETSNDGTGLDVNLQNTGTAKTYLGVFTVARYGTPSSSTSRPIFHPKTAQKPPVSKR